MEKRSTKMYIKSLIWILNSTATHTHQEETAAHALFRASQKICMLLDSLLLDMLTATLTRRRQLPVPCSGPLQSGKGKRRSW